MGVDVTMFVLPVKPLTDQERRLVSGDLASKVGREWFWITRPDDTSTFVPGDRHALQFVAKDEFYHELEGVDEMPEGLLEINSGGRYYGIGYERGSWLNIKTAAEALEVMLPGCTIWYGGDGQETLERFGADRRAEIHAHFLMHGHGPYRGYRLPGDTRLAPGCDFCGGREMNDIGGSADVSFFSCDGCGHRVVGNGGPYMQSQVFEPLTAEERQNEFGAWTAAADRLRAKTL